jgi:predicted phosphoribosyltransferase
VFVVRKIGVPGHEELAMGAIASGGVLVLDDRLVRALGVSRDQLERAIASEVASSNDAKLPTETATTRSIWRVRP